MKHWHQSHADGRSARITAEVLLACDGMAMPAFPRLYSHDATRQSGWERGWLSVTEFDIRTEVLLEQARRRGVSPGELGRAHINQFMEQRRGQ